jgi:hypothetical protein
MPTTGKLKMNKRQTSRKDAEKNKKSVGIMMDR